MENPWPAAKGWSESDGAVGAGSLAAGREQAELAAAGAAVGRGTLKPVSTQGVSSLLKAWRGWLHPRQLVGRGRSRGTAISPPSPAMQAASRGG